MRIATWNVNSVRARLPNIVEWLTTAEADVVLFQEIKCETADFPGSAFTDLGYHVHALGQKSYNGVAILSRSPLEDLREHLPDAEGDVQSRYLEATINGIRIANVYLPNGNPVGTEKFEYKLAFMNRLINHARRLIDQEGPVVLAGDFNIIPDAIDVYNPESWENDALFHPTSRQAWRTLLHLGYTEAFRELHPGLAHAYSFWDYQAGSWPRDQGLRIDHFLLSPEATDRLTSCHIDRVPRGQEKASDHTPVILELAA